MTKLMLLAGAAGLAIVSSPALAAPTLTFEGQANTIYNTPIVRSGFELGIVAGQEQHLHEIDSRNFGLASNGTGVLLVDRNTQLFLQSAVAGTAFALTSFDIASALNNNPGSTFTATGYLGGSVVGTVSGALGSSFATFGGFGNVDRVVFDGFGGGGGYELDNVVLNGARGAVPEPATWGMLMLGFALAGGALRRRSAKVSYRVA